jgi:hypothetical protein
VLSIGVYTLTTELICSFAGPSFTRVRCHLHVIVGCRVLTFGDAEEGNYDLVGLSWPVFFVRDPII